MSHNGMVRPCSCPRQQSRWANGRERERNMLGFVCSADEVSCQSGGARLDYQKDDLRFSIGGPAGPFQHSPFKVVDARISEQV